MSRLNAEMTLEQMDDFFSIGKTPIVESTARSKSGGRALDPITGEPSVHRPKTFIPPYRRHAWNDNPSQTAYAEKYAKMEEERMAHQMQAGSSRASTVSGMMEQLELDSTITGLSTILPEGKTEQEVNAVYKNYDFRHEYDKNLTITRYREEIVENIESNQVVVIHGATGSGKTTQVPQYILDHYAATGRYCNIVVTQPRRIAAQSIARRVCNERGWNLSGICGYQVGLDRIASEDTRLLYCTTAVLFNKLIKNKTMQHFTHVVLDEVHERDQDTDFCLLVVRKLLHNNSRDVKVILMSATAESEKFARYFSIPVRGCLEPAPIIAVEGRTYKISEYYLNDLEPLGQIPVNEEDKPGISLEAIDVTVKLIKQFDTIEAQQRQMYSNDPLSRGAVLVFLPGLSDINDLETKLSEHSDRQKWWAIPLHSSITGEEQARVFQRAEPGMRKIILSTNVAESSITVPDIKYVIDFCLTKNLIMDPETSYTCLQVQWAAKSNCIQRAGRAGRVSDGRVYKMVTRRFYKEVLPEHGAPEMERCPLTQIVLKAKVLDMGEPKAILGLALDPPRLDNIEINILTLKQRCPLTQIVLKAKVLDMGEPKAILGLALDPPRLDNIEINILTLKQIGALAPRRRGDYNRHDGELTFMGRVLADLPLDVHIGKLLLLGHVFGVLDDCIIIAACLTEKSFFARPFKSNLEAYKKRLNWGQSSFSDCIAYLNAYKTWEYKTETRAFGNIQHERRWGNQAFIQIKKIKDVGELVNDLRRRLRQNNIQSPRLTPHAKQQHALNPEEHQLLLKLVFCGAFYPHYFIQGALDVEESNKAMSGRNPCNTVMVKGLPQNQGAIYRKQIQQLFTHCETVPGARPKIEFEETKAFIEFTSDPTEDQSGNFVIAPVYVSIKMRLLRLPLRIQLYDNEAASRKMSEITGLSDEQARVESRLRTNRIKAVTDGAVSKTVRGPKQVDLPSCIQTIVPVYVTEVITCGHFWGHYNDPDTWRGLSMQQQHINAYQGNNLTPMRSESVSPGVLCLAPFMDSGSREYYRGRVRAVDKLPNNVTRITVFFVDYGNTDHCIIQELRDLQPDFSKLPFQAIEMELCGIKPSPMKCPNARWTQTAKDRFTSLVAMKGNLFAKVYSIVHGVLRVELIEQAPGMTDENINTRLINDNFADKCAESFLSKQNHEDRETEALMLPRSEITVAKDFDHPERYDLVQPTLGSGEPEPVLLRSVVQSTKENYFEMPPEEQLSAGRRDTPGMRSLHLTGPSSMYEMKFYSMTAIGSMREAKIERDSINCVAVSDQSHDPYQRMMVSAWVGLNPKKTTIMARDTTILPQIRGLPGIMALCFCPFAEMRADPELLRYTGALCGLGFSEETGGPVMPEDDMEITFDTTFDEEDLKLINGLRMGIYIAIGNESQAAEWGSEAILKIQRSTRKKLLSLVQRRRDPVEPYYFPRQHEWKQLLDEDLMYPDVGDYTDEGMHNPISLHCGIALSHDQDEEDEETKAYMREWADKERHVKLLHTLASGSTMRAKLHCDLCKVDLLTPRELSAHLALRTHKHKECIIQDRLSALS